MDDPLGKSLFVDPLQDFRLDEAHFASKSDTRNLAVLELLVKPRLRAREHRRKFGEADELDI